MSEDEGVCHSVECSAKVVDAADALRSTSLLWPTAMYQGSVMRERAEREGIDSPLLSLGMRGKGDGGAAEEVEAIRRRILASARSGVSVPCSHEGMHLDKEALSLGGDVLRGQCRSSLILRSPL